MFRQFDGCRLVVLASAVGLGLTSAALAPEPAHAQAASAQTDGVALAQGQRHARLADLLAGRLADPGVVGFLLQNLVSHDHHFDWRLNLAAIAGAVPALSGFPAGLQGRHYGGPATLIYGTRSDYVTPADAAGFADWFAQARTIAIDDAGHWVHAEQPAAFIAALRQACGAAA